MSLSAECLERAQVSLVDDVEWRGLGSTDCSVLLADGEQQFRVEFHAFRVREVRAVDASAARDCDIQITLADWDGYLQGRGEGTAPLLVELDLTDQIVSPGDARARLLFLRYHLSIQYFVDRLAATVAAA